MLLTAIAETIRCLLSVCKLRLAFGLNVRDRVSELATDALCKGECRISACFLFTSLSTFVAFKPLHLELNIRRVLVELVQRLVDMLN